MARDPIAVLAQEIAEAGEAERARLFASGWWNDRLMAWALKHPEFKTQLFRFVDVFPALGGHADVLSHLEEYFEDGDIPRLVDTGLGVAAHVPGGARITASVAEVNIMRMARQFIVGATPAEASGRLTKLWSAGRGFTADLLGEKTITPTQADRYALRVDELVGELSVSSRSWPTNQLLEHDHLGVLPRVNVSVKSTALAVKFAPMTAAYGIDEAFERLVPLLDNAMHQGAHIHFDAEHYDVKNLTQRLFRRVVTDGRFDDLSLGIVVQAYLRDSFDDLTHIMDLSRDRKIPLTVRLVKGAYWDAETIAARAAGWQPPVYDHKPETDANYERCVDALLDRARHVRGAFASHNLRSLAVVIDHARERRIDSTGFELQLLYGMAEPIHAGLTSLGHRVRVYAPVGDLVPGMAYLVRRLLENTSNESFVRARFAEKRQLDSLVKAPAVKVIPTRSPPIERSATDPINPTPYDPEPVREWRRPEVRASVERALTEWQRRHNHVVRVDGFINGSSVETAEAIESLDPSTGVVIARSASCSADDATRAITALQIGQPAWAERGVGERAAVLFRTAHWMRTRRDELIALEMMEAGRPRVEADAEICEAIDFCEYYGREAIRLDQGGRVASPPGEHNELRYVARGITAVIAPWNFPLAIPTGMVVAALVMGNAVALKPAEQTPLIARQLVDGLLESGLPNDVLAFLPGQGEVVGAALVNDERVHTIVFTGSAAVGLSIIENAAITKPNQRHTKRVVAEMGGKNPIVVDDDADLDLAIPAIVSSAFSFSGQKCSAASRVYVVGNIYEEFCDKIAQYVESLRITVATDESCEVGPLIDGDAQSRLGGARQLAYESGRVLVDRTESMPDVDTAGFFAAPIVVSDVDANSRLWSDEFFGPLLCVSNVGDFDEALLRANDTPYALTAGLFSRSPHNIERASREMRAGNLYINRGTTGAVVGRQPFGGYGLSGVGSKAGGPDYLLQFCEPRVVTENLLRQGFSPDLL